MGLKGFVCLMTKPLLRMNDVVNTINTGMDFPYMVEPSVRQLRAGASGNIGRQNDQPRNANLHEYWA